MVIISEYDEDTGHLEVSLNEGTHSYHPIIDRILHFWATPIYGTPHI